MAGYNGSVTVVRAFSNVLSYLETRAFNIEALFFRAKWKFSERDSMWAKGPKKGLPRTGRHGDAYNLRLLSLTLAFMQLCWSWQGATVIAHARKYSPFRQCIWFYFGMHVWVPRPTAVGTVHSECCQDTRVGKQWIIAGTFYCASDPGEFGHLCK